MMSQNKIGAAVKVVSTREDAMAVRRVAMEDVVVADVVVVDVTMERVAISNGALASAHSCSLL